MRKVRRRARRVRTERPEKSRDIRGALTIVKLLLEVIRDFYDLFGG